MAEVIKYGAIQDEKLFETLENHMDSLMKGFSDRWISIIQRCAAIKAEVVGQDRGKPGACARC